MLPYLTSAKNIKEIILILSTQLNIRISGYLVRKPTAVSLDLGKVGPNIEGLISQIKSTLQYYNWKKAMKIFCTLTHIYTPSREMMLSQSL